MEKFRLKINLVIILLLVILSGCSTKDHSDILKNTSKVYPKCEILIVVDFSIHSGKNRMFVYDLKTYKCLLKCLCAHGCGLSSTKSEPVFSNNIGSNCSSLGYFKVGSYNVTRLNLPSYVLDGLNSTNYNARKRQLLIHPYYTIPNFEIYPFYLGTEVSKGCFVTDPISFKKLQNIINRKYTMIYSYC